MARKKEPAKPYYSVRHEFIDSLEAHEQAAMMLYNAVTTVLQLSTHITDPAAKRLLEELNKHAEAYRKATYE